MPGCSRSFPRREVSHYWVRGDLGGLELLRGRFRLHAYRPHSHPGFVIAVVTAGVEAVNCRGSLHRAGPGDILFVNPEEIHDGERGVDDGWAYRVFYPTIAALRAFVANHDGDARATPYFHDTVVRDPALARRLAELHTSAETSRSSLGLQAGWAELMAELLARHSTSRGLTHVDKRETARVRRVRDLIEAQSDQSLSLDRLAAEAQVSPFHLLRLFKAETGTTPHAYQIACRLRRAKALLDRRIGAAETASAAGFFDQSHFLRQFKAAYGFTPGQYAAVRAAHA